MYYLLNFPKSLLKIKSINNNNNNKAHTRHWYYFAKVKGDAKNKSDPSTPCTPGGLRRERLIILLGLLVFTSSTYYCTKQYIKIITREARHEGHTLCHSVIMKYPKQWNPRDTKCRGRGDGNEERLLRGSWVSFWGMKMFSN